MPAPVVGREVKVIQMGGKIVLTPAPVNAEVLDQEARGHHAQAVVHVAGLVDLGHRGIDQRVAGASLAPGREQRLGLAAVFPGDRVVRGLVGAVRHMRKVRQNREIKVAPDQFAKPDCRPRAAVELPLQRDRCQLADRYGAESQVDTEIAWSLEGRKITGFMVLVQAREEILEQFCGA